mmetsp:Transcript_3015/g.6590  ORF Transcript_3015/g.6590 Transcript_3015/m.6590 type:complete len:95 (-) Transcript_3015:17-301(-)
MFFSQSISIPSLPSEFVMLTPPSCFPAFFLGYPSFQQYHAQFLIIPLFLSSCLARCRYDTVTSPNRKKPQNSNSSKPVSSWQQVASHCAQRTDS